MNKKHLNYSLIKELVNVKLYFNLNIINNLTIKTGDSMKKIMLIILLLSCNKIAKTIAFRNKDIDEDLVLAVINNEADEAKELIEAGADINYMHNNKFILELSLDNKNLDIVKVLLEKNVEINENNMLRIYDLSSEDFNYDVIDLIKDEYKLEEGLIDNKYFLLLCYISNEEEVKRFIEKNKINPGDVKDKFNRNGLIISAASNNMDLFKMLVEDYKFDINHRNNNGCTALIYSSEKGHIEIVRLLLNRGANVNDKEKNDWAALMFASQEGHVEVAKLINKGGNIDNKENNGCAALIFTALNCHKYIVKLLIKRGTNIYEKDKSNKTTIIKVKSF